MAIFTALGAVLGLVLGCSSGSGGNNTPQPGAPSNLVYSQATITATVGQAITADTPTVTGTVASYAVSPSLPAGLSLSSSTGAISGTPTAVSAQAAYTITATNSAGSTSTTIQIAVSATAVPPPSNLVYPQATITATVGQAIATDTPTVTGTVASYAVSPSLPAGLSLDSTTGAISGTPTAVSAQAAYTVTATNSSGSTTATIQIVVNSVPPPSNLVYPQTTITAYVGRPITPDTPTVTGTVTSYAVSPALPTGLSLNSTTGTISGTPTVLSTQAPYTITATNSSGSTTATIQIVVYPLPPAGVRYGQTTITATVGQAITTDIPITTDGTGSPIVGSILFTVTPALPAGLNLDSSTGVITGTPTAVTPLASYDIRASNAGGFVTVAETITVNAPLTSLLDLGHAAQINLMRVNATQLLSQDTTGHWALWNYTANTELASGDPYWQPYTYPKSPWPVDMAGSTVAIGITNGLELRSSSDGHLLSTIISPMIDPADGVYGTWWKLASDGSYICAGSNAGLTVWSPAGQVLVSRQGDYSTAKVFAAPGQVLVALGAAGPTVIETIATSNGTSSVGPAFSGQFNSWFVDGGRFLTNTGNAVSVYSNASVLQETVASLPTVENLAGEGNWFWSYSITPSGYPLAIYSAVGGNTTTYNLSGTARLIPSGTTLGVLNEEATSSVIDLSGSTPVKTDFTLPVAYTSAYAATSTSQWLIGNQHGVILDGTTLSATPRFFGLGAAWSIAGGTGRVAVATASGTIFYFDPAVTTPEGTIAFSSSKVALSSDGTVLAAAANANDGAYETDRTLKIFSLPAGTQSYSTTYQYLKQGTPQLYDFSLSGSGTSLGQVLGTYNGTTSTYTRQVTPIAGTPILWSDNPFSLGDAVQLSPDGTLIAVSFGLRTSAATTNIYKNGSLVIAVPGWVVGWIDNNQVLVNNYTTAGYYSSSTIYDATGAKLATPNLPNELQQLQPVNSTSIYSPALNTIFSLTTGAPIWFSTSPSTGVGAMSGNYDVFASGNHVLVDTY